MDSLYTQKRGAKFRGPTTSDDYNARVEENYRDLVNIMNKAGIAEENRIKTNRYIFKNLVSLSQKTDELMSLVGHILNGRVLTSIEFFDDSFIDNDTFNGTEYAITNNSRCVVDINHGYTTLPEVNELSASKIKFTNSDGTSTLPSTFMSAVVGLSSTADRSTSYINTTDIAYAIVGGQQSVWERNVVTPTNYDDAQCNLYIAIPVGVSSIPDVNCIILDAYPFFGTDIVKIEYTTKANPVLSDSDDYEPLNIDALYDDNINAIGKLPPGGWANDPGSSDVNNAGPLKFNFDPKPITAIRIRLRQRTPFVESGKYIFTYGLNNLDIRYNKFLDEGKFIVKLTSDKYGLISEITDVEPEIYNVSQAELPYVFDYRVIYETSPGSGVYTLTPVANSENVWIEVTLRKTLGNGTPELSALNFTFE